MGLDPDPDYWTEDCWRTVAEMPHLIRQHFEKAFDV